MGYGGFFIEGDVGNNRFSLEERKNKKIYVPELIEGGIESVKTGKEPAFIEVSEGEEKICTGLENIYRLKGNCIGEKEVYLFDNHNHAFYFWCRSVSEGRTEKGIPLVHIDQHKDTREPENYIVDIEDMEDVSRYTNEVLNVGSFIKPALEKGIFSSLFIIDSTYAMKERKYLDEDYVLDIDLDFFSPDMDYIDLDERVDVVREYIKRAGLITIATSPYFIDQDRALEMLKILFDVEKI